MALIVLLLAQSANLERAADREWEMSYGAAALCISAIICMLCGVCDAAGIGRASKRHTARSDFECNALTIRRSQSFNEHWLCIRRSQAEHPQDEANDTNQHDVEKKLIKMKAEKRASGTAYNISSSLIH